MRISTCDKKADRQSCVITCIVLQTSASKVLKVSLRIMPIYLPLPKHGRQKQTIHRNGESGLFLQHRND